MSHFSNAALALWVAGSLACTSKTGPLGGGDKGAVNPDDQGLAEVNGPASGSGVESQGSGDASAKGGTSATSTPGGAGAGSPGGSPASAGSGPQGASSPGRGDVAGGGDAAQAGPVFDPGVGGGARQCVRSGATSRGFGLAEPASEDFQPVTVVVTVTRERDGRVTNSSCTGVLYNARWGIGTLKETEADDSKGKAPDVAAGEVRYALFPRITVAKHCLVKDEDAPIVKLGFQQIGSEDKTIVYSLAADGTTKIGDEDGLWHLDTSRLVEVERDSECRQAARDGKSQMACFTTGGDRFEITTRLEWEARRFGAAKGSKSAFYALPAVTLDRIKEGVLEASGVEKGDPFGWKALFKHENARALSPLYYEDDNIVTDGDKAATYSALLGPQERALFSFRVKTQDEAYKYLDDRLHRIMTSRLSQRSDDKGVIAFKKPGCSKDDPAACGWKNLLTLWGETEGTGDKAYYKITAIGINSPELALRKGDSGTLLIGEWLTVTRPLLTVYSYSQLFGNLESVGGVDVCEGDDLTCCGGS